MKHATASSQYAEGKKKLSYAELCKQLTVWRNPLETSWLSETHSQSKSASGTTEAPGKNVRAKSVLNQSILDQGWDEFRRQLDDKLAWNGGQLIAIPPQNTSRTCPCCGHIAEEKRLSRSRSACVECDFKGDADVVGAIHVLRAGHARLACAETSPAIGASGQESTEVTQAARTA